MAHNGDGANGSGWTHDGATDVVVRVATTDAIVASWKENASGRQRRAATHFVHGDTICVNV